MNAPTILDCILACIYGIPALILLIICLLPLNPHYDPEANDPYRYCPKEEK